MKLPLIKGSRVDSGAEWRDSLPLNMVGFSQSIADWSGFMRTADGLKTYATGFGQDRGGIWSDRFKKHVRLSGQTFAEVGQFGDVTSLSGLSIPGSNKARFDNSFNSIAFVANGDYYRFASGTLTNVTKPVGAGDFIDMVWIDGYYIFTDGENLWNTTLADEAVFNANERAGSDFAPDDLRDKGFLNRRIMASSKKLNADLNKRMADLVASTGSLYYESSSVGYDFIAEANTLFAERQLASDMGRSFFVAPRVSQVMSSDLASRDSSLSDINKKAYESGLINPRIAGFKVYDAPTYGTIPARLNATTTTVSGDVTEVPRGYQTVSGNNVNVDYRYGVIPFTAVTNFQEGDIITIAGVNALGIMDKTDTGELMTFKIIDISGLNVTVYPKPIAADQAGITDEQAAYANISTAIVSTMVISKVNATGGQANSFWANDSVCIVAGDAPLETLNEFDGMKVVSETLDSGAKLYMAYDARLDSLQARVRLFTWYGLANKDPSRNGNAIFVPA